MKISYFLPILIISFALNSICFSQTLNDFNKNAVGKEWQLNMYELNGENFPPVSGSENDQLIFYSDNTVKSIEKNRSDIGIWKYDEMNKCIVISKFKERRPFSMKVIELTNDLFIVEHKDRGGNHIIMHMKSMGNNR